MISVGKTFQDFRNFIANTELFTNEEKISLYKFINLQIMERDLELEDEFIDVMGGDYLIPEDTSKDFEYMKMNMLPMLNEAYSLTNVGMDCADYLNRNKTMAILGTCTNNGGGNMFIIRKELFDKYPGIHEHMVHYKDWMDTEIDIGEEQQTFINLVEGMTL
jgi:hypothetical protein